jgi:hypothetical protein
MFQYGAGDFPRRRIVCRRVSRHSPLRKMFEPASCPHNQKEAEEYA